MLEKDKIVLVTRITLQCHDRSILMRYQLPNDSGNEIILLFKGVFFLDILRFENNSLVEMGWLEYPSSYGHEALLKYQLDPSDFKELMLYGGRVSSAQQKPINFRIIFQTHEIIDERRALEYIYQF